jgi:hypothetical protein
MRNVLFFVLFTAGAAQAQEGVYIRPLGSGSETLEFSSAACTSRISQPGTAQQVRTDRIAAQDHGRLVLGPTPNQLKPFEMLYVVEMTGDWIEVFRDKNAYSGPDEAPEYPTALQLRQGQRYWTVPCYHLVTELPTMPVPARDDIAEMLDTVRATLHAGAGAHAVDEELEDLVIAKGYNPFTSKQVFRDAKERYEKRDPDFRNKVQEFERWTEGDARTTLHQSAP